MSSDVEQKLPTPPAWGIFDRFGVELEYMICHSETLDILPITDQVLHALYGAYVNEVDLGGNIACSNELALHVIEFKTIEPVSELTAQVASSFHTAIRRISELLKQWNACLVPSAMHPWMNPEKELKLWSHEYNPIYEAYDRIFTCRGHGWANLQSTHLNISFSTDEEFKALHSAIRWLLPLMPALSASSPFIDSNVSGLCDTRLEVYRFNQKAIPSIAGHIIPEPVRSRQEYHDIILTPMWLDIAPYDPDAILQEEWLNSRGAIARFDRMAIEIRVLDIQEHPAFDIAILQAIIHVLKSLAGQVLQGKIDYDTISTIDLSEILLSCVRYGSRTRLQHQGYLSLFGLQGQGDIEAQDVWRTILGEDFLKEHSALQEILSRGNLSERMLSSFSSSSDSRSSMKNIYRALSRSLLQGDVFLPLQEGGDAYHPIQDMNHGKKTGRLAHHV